MMREEKPCCEEKMMREEKSCCCEKKAKDCGCMKNDMYHDTDQLPLAMAYVPWQKFSCVYELCDAFKAGTAFPELYKPFNPKGGKCR